MRDQLDRILHINKTPKRIISLVPSQTELLCDLGLERSLVGVTKFCIHPIHLNKNVNIVGGTKQIDLNKIKALQPDIILCNKEENTENIVNACETICNVHISDICTIQDCLELIIQYGDIFNKKNESLTIIKNINKEINDFKIFTEHQPFLKVVYFIWKNPWIVAANHTFINHLLELNKFENVYGFLERYPEIEFDNNNLKLNIDLILLSSEPYPFKEKHKIEMKILYPNAKIMFVDGEMFSWYGSRLLKAFKYFKNLRLSL